MEEKNILKEELETVTDVADTESKEKNIIICKHCGKHIDHTQLIGLSLICPLCGKPQNGHPKEPDQDLYLELTLICKHCGEKIKQSDLRGISLMCPLCKKPQNGDSDH